MVNGFVLLKTPQHVHNIIIKHMTRCETDRENFRTRVYYKYIFIYIKYT